MASRRSCSLIGLVAATLAGGIVVSGEGLLELTARLDATVRGESFRGVRCAYREATSKRCVGCGGTTAFLLAREGRVDEALRENALGTCVLAGLLAATVGGLASIASGRALWTGLGVLGGAGLCAFGLLIQTVRWWMVS